MFLEITISTIIGILLGIVTGITPGLHINLVATSMFSLSPLLINYFNPITIAVILVSMSITHTFLDFIPSIFLGAPDSETALAVLPGHTLLLRGRAYEAVKLSVVGGLIGLIFVIVLMPFLLFLVPRIYDNIRTYIGWLLLIMSIFMILREKNNNKRFWSFLVFSLSGLLGMIVFSIPNLKEPLLAMLSGLFGISMIINSIFKNTEIPEQMITKIKINKNKIIKPILAGTFSSSLVSIFPALGPAQAAILASQVFGQVRARAYLVMMGCINAVSVIFGLITLYTISKARNGPIVIVQEMIKNFGLKELILLLIISIITAGISVILSLFFGKIFTRIINKINYKKISMGVILLISLMVFYFSGFLGILILITATAIGLIPNLLDIGRHNSMGCLLVPVILYFIL
jgi:putative membrane protein